MKHAPPDHAVAPVVTDHAVLRFLERSGAVDVEKVRREIARAMIEAVRHDAATCLWGGVRFVIEDGHVVTALEKGWTFVAGNQAAYRARKGRDRRRGFGREGDA